MSKTFFPNDDFKKPTGDEAKQARDEALERVAEKSKMWQQQALALIPYYPEREATGEALRLWVSEQIGPPHHHNAAGALIAQARRLKLIERTGEWVPMKLKRSHARMNPVYEIK